MKEVAKMLSDLRGCLAKRFTNKNTSIKWEIVGYLKDTTHKNTSKIDIRQEFSNNTHYTLYVLFDFNENTSYISFYKTVLKTINNE
jgi:hypothetical protein